MNDNTTKLIEQLAAKLGTTSQYLWGVLLKQAPIDATINVLLTILFGIYVYILCRLNKKFSAEPRTKGEITLRSLYSCHDSLGFTMLIFAIIGVLWALHIVMDCTQNIVTGYFNPEYWALHKVLEAVK